MLTQYMMCIVVLIYVILFINAYTRFLAQVDNATILISILPSVIMLVNNQETQLVRYDNYQFGIKTFGKQAACFLCTNKGCYASISLKVKDSKIIEPYVISSSNSEHKKDTCKKTDDYFNVKKFY